MPFLLVFFLVAFYSSTFIHSFSLKASLRALSDWSLQSCFYLISDVFPSIQPSRSCQGELHLIRYDYSTNTIVPVMTFTQSSDLNNTRIIKRITPNFNAYFNRYFITTYGNCCWRLYKRLVNKFLSMLKYYIFEILYIYFMFWNCRPKSRGSSITIYGEEQRDIQFFFRSMEVENYWISCLNCNQ